MPALPRKNNTQFNTQGFKDQALSAYQDRMSLRGIQRTFGGCCQTVRVWLGEKTEQLPACVDPLLPSEKGDVLELDELWSFVQAKAQTLWLWVALYRRTRQIVAWSLGDRSEQGHGGPAGGAWRQATGVAPRAVTFGGLTKRPSQRERIAAVPRGKAKPATSNAGSALCASA